ncbi:MAG: Nicotinate-nucleotide pyrophosphorylase [Pseudomonadota bacterium]|jgi:nicotinate-nucleotide pyrophosphorylase (carboxylating)
MTHLSAFTPNDLAELARMDVQKALAEDVGDGDLTAALVPADRPCVAKILAREPAVLCGKAWVEAAIVACDPSARLTWHVDEGEWCAADQVVVDIQGLAQPLLTAERTALNFLQLLSGVATRTAHYVDAVKGTKAAIVDTRKTLPGLRLAQKYAVKVGGGVNHRIGLYDAVLIKENHIAAAGGIAQVLERVEETAPNAQFIEIEVETLAQLDEALACGAQMVLLDNMPVDQLEAAVARNAGRAVLEISGGVNEGTVTRLAQTGVDRISIGALTKDVKAVDYSMRFVAL